MRCDEIFALYLVETAKRVNEAGYGVVLRFVLLYRDSLNSSAAKLNEDKKKLPDMLRLKAEDSKGATTEAEYTQSSNAEQVPDASNDFVTRYLRSQPGVGLSFEDAKGLTVHLNYWLFHNRYTCSTVSLAEEKSAD